MHSVIIIIGFFLLTIPSLFFKEKLVPFITWNSFLLLMISAFIKDVFCPKYYNLYIEGDFLCWDTPDEQEKILISNIDSIELGGESIAFLDDMPQIEVWKNYSGIGGTVILKEGEDIVMPSVLARGLASTKCLTNLSEFINIV
jgi:hypothetical protein